MITASTPPRFLIIQTAFIGDVILATALLEQLHQARPDARIDLLVRRGNEGLLANHPFLNEVLIWEKKTNKYGSLWQLLQTIRTRRYNAVLNLQRYGTTGLLTAFSRAEIRIGFNKNPFSRFFTHRVEHRFAPGVHEVDRNAQMLHALTLTPGPSPRTGEGSNTPGSSPLSRSGRGAGGEGTRPKLYPSPADYDAVKSYQAQPYVCIAPTSVWFTKQYPAERWAELIGALPDTTMVYLLGAPADVAACEHIREQSQQANRVVVLAGQLSLLQSAALQQGAAMNYVNDSAPLHLCSAMNAPTTAVFCSTVPEFGFGPLADVSRVVQVREPLECKPCGLHGRKTCPLGHFECGWGISVDELAHL
ncbi:glycosyltransferase family 9 protein [Spirosoma montaniterrae]|uniref:Heptosyltransferase n=1 Tax=Spirosoma montaniterrae TaxID=1178516 RepID=A0A1P9X093_9BACT|nr:glycosyltransferase family 9 protein [Spirosoma montaniterrae]AQG81032.1 heptosyltransferase [Spirosoma montaniterrae]